MGIDEKKNKTGGEKSFLSAFPSFILHPSSFILSSKRGQTTVEYLLMLAMLAGASVIFGQLFYKKILGAFFTLIGMAAGAGKPA